MTTLLVTGGCGFIGSNLVRHLLEAPTFAGRILNVDALTYAAHPGNLDGLAQKFPGRYRFVEADICDPTAMDRLFDEHDVDRVCHLAAESHVDRSIAEPAPFIRSNILGTYTLLEAARRRAGRIRRFHQVSTDEVFGDLAETHGIADEHTPYAPSSPYSASKASADHLVRAYGRTYGLPVSISCCSNNYGPYQFPEKLIPLCILAAAQGDPLPLYGDGSQERDWIFVEDHCAALHRILEAGRDGATYLVSSGMSRKNSEVIRRLADLMDRRLPALPGGPRRGLITSIPDRPGHDRRYALCNRQTTLELGWEPRVSLDEGLARTIDWYLDHPEWVASIRTGAYRQWPIDSGSF